MRWMEEPFKYEVEESVEVRESVELEEVPETRNIFQAQGLVEVEEVDHAVEEQLESTPEEPVDKPVKCLAYSAKVLAQEAKLLGQEFVQMKEEQLQIEVEFETLGRNAGLGSRSTFQVQESVDGLNNSNARRTIQTQNKEIASGMNYSPVLHGVKGAEAVVHLEYFTSNKAGHSCTPESEGSRRYIYGLGSGNNHSTALHFQTLADMGEVDTNYAWNFASAYLSCVRTEVADHMWHPRHKLFANCDDDGGGASILAAQSGDIFQFISSGPSGHASSSKSVTWEVHLFWVTRLSFGDLHLLEPSSDITLLQMNVLGYPWQHLRLPVRKQVEQKHTDCTEHFQQRVEPEPKMAFTSQDLISAAEVILYVEQQLGFELRGRASPISTKIIASLDWILDDANDLQLILNQQFSNDTASSVRCCLLCYNQLSNQQCTSRERKALRRDSIYLIATAQPNQIILLPRTHVFKETDAHATQTQAQVLYIVTMSASQYLPSANGECQSDYRESYGYGLSDFLDPLAFESSKITAQPLQLQSSLRIPSHAWLAMSRHMRLDSLSPRAPNITARRINLDEGDSESFHSGRFDRTHAQFSPYEVFRLYLNLPMLSDQVVSDAKRTTIVSMYQTGWDDYHLKRDAPKMRYLSLAVALFLLCFVAITVKAWEVLLSHLLIDVRVDILEALKETFIEWEFQQRQQAKCIATQLNMIDINWNIASRILANKAQRWKSNIELGRLHSESGPCWTQFDHRERQMRNRQHLLRVGKALEKPSKKRRMMQRKSRSCLRSSVSVGCLCPDGVIGISFFVYCSVLTCSSSSLLFTNAFNVAFSLLLHTFRVQASSLQR